MNPNTSFERVNSLERLSTRVHDAADQTTGGEPRYRRMVRLGVNLLDDELNQGNTLEAAGEQLISLMIDHFERGGLSLNDPAYDAFPEFRDYAQSLPPAPFFKTSGLNSLANQYADVRRATLDRSGNFETDGRHAIHLMALAVPYSLQYYPELRPGIIAADSLLHDFPEVITGDTSTFGMSHADYAIKVAREQGGMPRLKQEFGSEHARLFQAIHSYEEQDHPEASYTKAFDKEDAYFTHLTNKGFQFVERYKLQSAEEFIESTVPTTERIKTYKQTFPLLQEDRAEFIRRLAECTDWPIAN